MDTGKHNYRQIGTLAVYVAGELEAGCFCFHHDVEYDYIRLVFDKELTCLFGRVCGLYFVPVLSDCHFTCLYEIDIVIHQ